MERLPSQDVPPQILSNLPDTHLRMASKMVCRSKCDGNCCRCKLFTNLVENVSRRLSSLKSDVAGSNLHMATAPACISWELKESSHTVCMAHSFHCSLLQARCLLPKRCRCIQSDDCSGALLFQLRLQIALEVQLLPGLAIA